MTPVSVHHEEATLNRPACDLRTCVVTVAEAIRPSETFIRAHVESLPGTVTLVVGRMPHVAAPGADGPGEEMPARRWLFGERVTQGRIAISRERATRAYRRLFKQHRIDVVLAEFGIAGAWVMDACLQAGVPLVVCFRGYDATRRDVLDAHAEAYPILFERAGAIVVSSCALLERLREMGASQHKLYYNASGVDCRRFRGGDPSGAPPVFLTVGRFTEKKGPHLTLLAFAEVLRAFPEARLRMIGEGRLFEACIDLARALGLAHAVTFLGHVHHGRVRTELRGARGLIHHSIVPRSGNTEGTPNAILEAAACGLPVVASRHGGIPEAVLDHETGYLVEERDIGGTADRVLRLARQPELAGELGRAGRRHMQLHYTREQSLERLVSIIRSVLPPRRAASIGEVWSRRDPVTGLARGAAS